MNAADIELASGSNTTPLDNHFMPAPHTRTNDSENPDSSRDSTSRPKCKQMEGEAVLSLNEGPRSSARQGGVGGQPASLRLGDDELNRHLDSHPQHITTPSIPGQPVELEWTWDIWLVH